MFNVWGSSIRFNEKSIFEAKEELKSLIFDSKNDHIIVCYDSHLLEDNVICLDRYGNELWRMEGFSSHITGNIQPYTSLRIDADGNFWAYSASGWSRHFDPATGNIIRNEWTG